MANGEGEKGGKIVSTGNTTCACGPGCTCGCGHYYAHRIIWWVVGIVILGIVFCIGVKAGEFRDELRGMFGGYYGRGGYPVMHQYQGGYGNYDGGAPVPATGGAAGSATGTTGNAPMMQVQ